MHAMQHEGAPVCRTSLHTCWMLADIVTHVTELPMPLIQPFLNLGRFLLQMAAIMRTGRRLFVQVRDTIWLFVQVRDTIWLRQSITLHLSCPWRDGHGTAGDAVFIGCVCGYVQVFMCMCVHTRMQAQFRLRMCACACIHACKHNFACACVHV